MHVCMYMYVWVCGGRGGEWLGLGLWGCVSVGCVCVYIQYTLRYMFTIYSS